MYISDFLESRERENFAGEGRARADGGQRENVPAFALDSRHGPRGVAFLFHLRPGFPRVEGRRRETDRAREVYNIRRWEEERRWDLALYQWVEDDFFGFSAAGFGYAWGAAGMDRGWFGWATQVAVKLIRDYDDVVGFVKCTGCWRFVGFKVSSYLFFPYSKVDMCWLRLFLHFSLYVYVFEEWH